MSNGAYNLEAHKRTAPRDTLLWHREGLTGAEAAVLMEQHLDKALILLLRERSDRMPTRTDHEALRMFQERTGYRLLRN